MPRAKPERRVVWGRIAAVLAICGLFLALWTGSPATAAAFDRLASWLAPHREAWYALPLVMLAFVTLGLVMVPVLLAIHPLAHAYYIMGLCGLGFAVGLWLLRAEAQRR